MEIIYQKRGESLTIRLTRDNNYPWHMHRHIELFYVLDGAITISIGKKQATLEKGMLSLAFPDMIHKTETTEKSLALMVIFTPELLPDFHQEFVNEQLENPFVTEKELLKEITGDLEYLLKYTQREYETKRSAANGASEMDTEDERMAETVMEQEDIRIIKGYLYLIFGKLFRQLTLQPKAVETLDICQKIAHYLNTHFSEAISLTELAEELGYSRFHISHIFKEKFGCSLSDYLNRMRAEYAMELLTTSDMSITEICFASGFSSQRTFYRAFEKLYGKAPGNFKS